MVVAPNFLGQAKSLPERSPTLIAEEADAAITGDICVFGRIGVDGNLMAVAPNFLGLAKSVPGTPICPLTAEEA